MYKYVMTYGKPDATRKSCSDCIHVQGAINMWCMNDEAAKYNGTRIPKWKNCKFWEPIVTIEILKEQFKKEPWYVRIFGFKLYKSGYIECKNI